MSRAAAGVTAPPDADRAPGTDDAPSAVRPTGDRGLYLLPSSPKLARRRKSAVGTVRRAKVHARTCRLESGYVDYPLIRLSGRWLDDAGFLQGQRFEVEVSEGKLVLRTV